MLQELTGIIDIKVLASVSKQRVLRKYWLILSLLLLQVS